jgi:uncharacterized protein (DUF4415 family)
MNEHALFQHAPRHGKKGKHIMKKHDKALTKKQLATVQDSDLNFSDLPELNDNFWKKAEMIEPDNTEQVTLRIKGSVLNYFKASGKGYQTRINHVLESYVRAHDS